MESKICPKCKQQKELSLFSLSKDRKDGHKVYCKKCSSIEGAKYRKNNLEKCRLSGLIYSRTHKKERQQYSIRNKEKANGYKRKYIEKNPERRKEQARNYYHRHKEKVKQSNNLHKKERNAKRVEYNRTHPQARIAHNLRTRIGHFLNGRSKGGRLYKLVGCSMDFLKRYLENMFEKGMNWSNYGKGIGKWSLDHIIPLNNFDLTKEEDVLKAFYYTNLQPMWYPQNASKSNRYSGKYKLNNNCVSL